MKTKLSLLGVVLVSLVLLGAGCGSTSSEVLEVNDESKITKVNREKINQKIEQTGDKNKKLNATENRYIIYMIEGEKMARDLYYHFSQKYDFAQFEELYKAEQSQLQAIKQLAKKYDIENPAAKKDVGQFKNPEIQQFYDEFLKQGNKNLEEALKASSKAEEVAIQIYLRSIDGAEKADTKFVFEQLNIAAKNHLRLLAETLEEKEVDYKPEHLDQPDYNRIIHSSLEPRPWWRFW
jgi:hypothetical protein